MRLILKIWKKFKKKTQNHSTYEEHLAISKSPSLNIRGIIAIAIQSFEL
jgi:hypothetical protein